MIKIADCRFVIADLKLRNLCDLCVFTVKIPGVPAPLKGFMICPLCGLRYSERDSKSACASCPVGGSCGLMKCPNCGYEQPPARPRNGLGFFSRWKKRHRPAHPYPATEPGKRIISLADAEAGMKVTVFRLNMDNRKTVRKLLTMGIMPGASLSVDRCSPAFVVTVGGSQIAMDHTMASAVFLQC